MTASALLRYGVEYAAELVTGLTDWMTEKGFTSVDEVRGLLAVPREDNAGRFETRRLRRSDPECEYRRVRGFVTDYRDVFEPSRSVGEASPPRV
jgi:hypothetical protein